MSVITTAAELLLVDPTVRASPASGSSASHEQDAERERSLRRCCSLAATTRSMLQSLWTCRPSSTTRSNVYLPVARAKGLDLQVDSSGEQLLTAPPAAASIILQNLIENAIRFTARGSVRVLLEPGRLAVEDTGVGLGGVDHERIFERGYRSDVSPGSGLGLDLIRRVCDRVGWQVSAHQRPTGGSRFEVIFSASAVA